MWYSPESLEINDVIIRHVRLFEVKKKIIWVLLLILHEKIKVLSVTTDIKQICKIRLQGWFSLATE